MRLKLYLECKYRYFFLITYQINGKIIIFALKFNE